MIYGSINQLVVNEMMSDYLQCYLDELKKIALKITKEELLSPRKFVMDGDKVFVNFDDYHTVPSKDKFAEAHQVYIDIHYVLSGEESIEFADFNQANPIHSPYDPDKDFCLLKSMENSQKIIIKPGFFALFFPNEPHKPGCHVGGGSQVKKLVMKIHKDVFVIK